MLLFQFKHFQSLSSAQVNSIFFIWEIRIVYIRKSIAKLELLISLISPQFIAYQSSKLQNYLSPFYCPARVGDAAQCGAQKSEGLLQTKSSTSVLPSSHCMMFFLSFGCLCVYFLIILYVNSLKLDPALVTYVS